MKLMSEFHLAPSVSDKMLDVGEKDSLQPVFGEECVVLTSNSGNTEFL